MARDKKVEAGTIRFVVLDALGRAAVRSDIPQSAVRTLLATS
jgi:3-dehydroquinate synthetase